jgi:hypothetical protein
MCKHHHTFAVLVLALVALGAAAPAAEAPSGPSDATPDAGLRRYIYSLHPDGSQEGYNCGTKTGKSGIYVLDIDGGCTFVRRIALPCLEGGFGGHGGRGMTGHTGTKRVFYTFMLSNDRTKRFAPGKRSGGVVGCLDVETDRVLWETYLDEFPEAKGHKLGAGQAAITPDGKKLYVPPEWTGGNETTVLDASNGDLIAFIPTGGNGCGNAVMSPDGRYVYASRDAVRINTATDRIEWNVLDAGASAAGQKGTGRSQGPCPGHSHYMIDPTGKRIFGTYELPNGAATIFSAETGEVFDRLYPPDSGPKAFLWECQNLSHEVSFTPCGQRIWTQAMERHLPVPEDLLAESVVVGDGGSVKWVTEWDVSRMPGALVKAIATRSPGHCHAHALVTREGDLLLTGNGYALDTATGKQKGTWKDEEGRWFQGTKFMQVNFRDGKVDWVGHRHGTGWLYQVPPLSERGRAGGVAAAEPEGPADKTPPEAVGKLQAQVLPPQVHAPKVEHAEPNVLAVANLTWPPATDNGEIQCYAVYCDGALRRNVLAAEFTVRDLVPGKTCRLEVGAVDAAGNRGPRAAIEVAVPAVSEGEKERLVRQWLECLVTEAAGRAVESRNRAVRTAFFGVARRATDSAWALPMLKRLEPLAGDSQTRDDIRRRILSFQTQGLKPGDSPE